MTTALDLIKRLVNVPLREIQSREIQLIWMEASKLLAKPRTSTLARQKMILDFCKKYPTLSVDRLCYLARKEGLYSPKTTFVDIKRTMIIYKEIAEAQTVRDSL